LTSEWNFQFIAPDFVYEEIRNHLPKIITYTGKSKREVLSILKRLTEKVTFYTANEIPKKYAEQAIKIVKDIDVFDAPFVAMHLYTKHKIWTGDTELINGLKQKGYDICVTTDKLKQRLYKK